MTKVATQATATVGHFTDLSCADGSDRRCRSYAAWSFAVSLAILSTTSPTCAASSGEFDTYRMPKFPLIDPPPSSGWIVTFGAQLQGSPDYVGSSNFAPGGSPIFSIRRWDQPEEFSAPDDNLQVALLGDRRYAVGFVGNVDFGRYGNGNPALTGLNKIHWAPEAGVYAEYWPIIDRFRLRGEVRYSFAGEGLVSVLGADWIERYGDLTFNFGPRLQVADASYLSSYFGVTPQQAVMNGGVTPFKLDAGVQYVGVEAALRYRYNKSWEVGVFGQYDRLVDDVARSPITLKYGTVDQIVFGITAKYSFRLN